MTEKKTTKIIRSWSATFGYLGGGIVLLGISAAMFASFVQGPITLGIALLPAIVGLVLLYMSFGGAGSGTCPGCDKPLDGLSTSTNDGVLCRICHCYCEGQNGSL